MDGRELTWCQSYFSSDGETHLRYCRLCPLLMFLVLVATMCGWISPQHIRRIVSPEYGKKRYGLGILCEAVEAKRRVRLLLPSTLSLRAPAAFGSANIAPVQSEHQ